MTEVAWAHPSVRDLVIEHLMSHEAERSDFLLKASVEGIVLALSTRGGGGGQRAFPFLVTESDWESAQKRLRELCEDEPEEPVQTLLSTVSAALTVARRDTLTIAERLAEVGREVLDVLCRRWNRQGAPTSLAALRLYIDISERINPLPCLPDLRGLWEASTGRLGSRLKEDEEAYLRYATLDELGSWLALASAIAASEPRLLRQVRFPGAFIDAVSEALRSMAAEIDEMDLVESVEEGEEPPGLSVEEEEEVERLSLIEFPLVSISELFPPLRAEAEAAYEKWDKASTSRADADAERDAWLTDRAGERYEEYEPDPSESSQFSDDSSSFSIALVFQDL